MTAFDWRRALALDDPAGAAADRLVGVVYGRNSPAEHPAVSAEELGRARCGAAREVWTPASHGHAYGR